MTIIKSSIKSNKIKKRNNIQNRIYKNLIKASIKNYIDSLAIFKESKTIQDFNQIEKDLKLVYSSIDKAVKKKVIHKNKALRKKYSLSSFIESI
jgi:small subunit ribosomal protein S20